MNKQVDVKVVPKIEVVGQAPPAKVVPQSAQPRYMAGLKEEEKQDREKKEKEDRHKAMIDDIRKKQEEFRKIGGTPQVKGSNNNDLQKKPPIEELPASTPRNVFETESTPMKNRGNAKVPVGAMPFQDPAHHFLRQPSAPLLGQPHANRPGMNNNGV